jgi:acyl-CoA thioester hydrolase
VPRTHRVTVERRFSDLDVLGHVNNVVYAVYLEEARVRLLTELGRLGVTAPAQVVARQEIDYLRPLGLKPEPVEVLTWVESVGTTSYVVGYEIRDDDGSVAARARSVLVCFDPATQRKAPIPDPMRAALEAAAGENRA